MIVRILSRGKSFKGLATYLTHDAREKTTERVAWTHTFNLANDHVPSAVDEMLWTARDAELLKQEAGVRPGGRSTEDSVKHLSLNWAPGENPSREHMVDATGQFLRHMKWHEHQAIVVAHDDKEYRHVHVMLNVVHPETGLRLDDNFERRRAQAWALEYEREHGRIHCEQRLLEPAAREKAPPRNIWMAFQENEKEFTRPEKELHENTAIFDDEAKNGNNREWKILKDIQRNQRLEFFAEGKSEFSWLRTTIYREGRQEFRTHWRDYYELEKAGSDREALAARKAELVAEQKAVLDDRRETACRDLREYRDGLYRNLLDEQRDTRAQLRARQEAGLDNTPFLLERRKSTLSFDVRGRFFDAANEATKPVQAREEKEEAASAFFQKTYNDKSSSRGLVTGGRFGSAAVSLFGTFLADLFNLGSAPAVEYKEPDRDLFEVAYEEAQKQWHHRRREEEDDEWRKRQRSGVGD